MRILKAFKTGWAAMDTTEKVKFVLGFVANVGAGFIGCDIAATCSAGKSKIEKVCYGVAGFGLGCAMGTAAERGISETIDNVNTLIEMHRKNKEEQANG